MLSQKLKEMKQRSGLTVEEISEKTNGELPISTINNLLSGRTQDARFSTIVAFVDAVGGSLSELETNTKKHDISHKHLDCSKCEDKLNKNKELYERIVNEQKDNIKELKDDKKRLEGIIEIKNKKLITVFCFSAIVLISLLAFILFDLFMPNIGWINY